MTDANKGELLDDVKVDLSKLKVAEAAQASGTGKGGFTVTTTTDSKLCANAIFDATNLNIGDTVTLNFGNPIEKTFAPKNIGLSDDSLDDLAGKFKTPTASVEKTVGVASITDANMNSDWKTVMDALNGSEITLSVTAAATAATGAVAPTIKANTSKVTIGGTDYTWAYASNALTLTNTAAIGSIAANTTLCKINLGDLIQEPTYSTAGAVDFKLKLEFDTYNAPDPAKAPDVSMTAGEPNTETVDNEIAKLEASKTPVKVSESDTFDNSKAIMNYAQEIVLQTGARTKDAVNFTFKYNKDETADMGNLKANLNLSSRTDGLATADLSLATAEDANYAIDQIDKAINKTSMVRASFGAIQNRLEHKIDNLTTTHENLTEAESNIRDTDMANEMMNYTKFNILQQAAQSMLAQANQQPQSILQLLG